MQAAPLVALLLFLGAVLGHTALMVRCHNWWYGTPLNRHVTDVVQVLHGLTVLAGPVFLWLAAGPDLRSLFERAESSNIHAILAGYVVLCWLTGFVALPAVTVLRRLRAPGALLSNHTRTVDVAEQLGRRPVGDGKLRVLASLPGNEIFKLDLAERTLLLPQLPPEWEGLTVLHLSDLHMCGTPAREYFERVADLCAEWEPDLIALTGDYIDGDRYAPWVGPVLGRLRGREAGLAILGNHDLWYDVDDLRRRLREAGFRYLGNGWERIEVRGRPMVVVGHEGPWQRPAPDLSGCPAGVFRLCLSHTPDNVRWAQRNKIDLLLCGHVHGGQVRLPVIGSVLVPSRHGRRYDRGVFEEPPTLMHVTSGVGGKEPVRYLCRPEAALLILRRPPP